MSVRYVLVDGRLTAPYGSGAPWVVLDLATRRMREPNGTLGNLPAALADRGATGIAPTANAVLAAVNAFFCDRYEHTNRILSYPQGECRTAVPASTPNAGLDIIDWLNGTGVSGHRRHPAAGDRGCVTVRAESDGTLAVVGDLARLLPKYRQPRSAQLAFLEAGHVIENACLRYGADAQDRLLTVAPSLGPDLVLRFASITGVDRPPSDIPHDWSDDAPVIVPWNGGWHAVGLDDTVRSLTASEFAELTSTRVKRQTPPNVQRLADAGWYGAFVAWLSRPPAGAASGPATSPLQLPLRALDVFTGLRRTTRSGFLPTTAAEVEMLVDRAHAEHDGVHAIVHAPTPELLAALGTLTQLPAPQICILTSSRAADPLSHQLISLGRVAQRLCLLATEQGLGVWPVHPEDDMLVRAACCLDSTGPAYGLGIGRVDPDGPKEK